MSIIDKRNNLMLSVLLQVPLYCRVKAISCVKCLAYIVIHRDLLLVERDAHNLLPNPYITESETSEKSSITEV
jgi:hypothetical protein